jgi:hypothetical protein
MGVIAAINLTSEFKDLDYFKKEFKLVCFNFFEYLEQAETTIGINLSEDKKNLTNTLDKVLKYDNIKL